MDSNSIQIHVGSNIHGFKLDTNTCSHEAMRFIQLFTCFYKHVLKLKYACVQDMYMYIPSLNIVNG